MRVALLERSEFPRDRACGGILVSPALEAVADLPDVPVGNAIEQAAFSLRGGPTTLRESGTPYVHTVDRTELDDWLAADAVDAGADLVAPCTVLSADQTEDDVVLETTYGRFSARIVVAADGPLGPMSSYAGVTTQADDLGIVLELSPGPLAKAWAGRMHLDFGPVPGSYGWIAPQGDRLLAGVMAPREYAADARKYLWRLLQWQRLDWMPVRSERGRVVRRRTVDSPLTRDRVMVAGEAAGLVEPWSREGISFAVRSGRIAGDIAAIAVIAESTAAELAVAYEDALSLDLLPEILDGELCLESFARRPAIFHQLFTRASMDWRTFRRVATDETAIARIARTGDVEGVVAIARAEIEAQFPPLAFEELAEVDVPRPAAEPPLEDMGAALTGTDGAGPQFTLF